MKPVTGIEIALCCCAVRLCHSTAKETVVSLFVKPIRIGIAVPCLVLWLIPSRFKKQYRPRLVFGTYLLQTYKGVKEYPGYVSANFLSFSVNISCVFF